MKIRKRMLAGILVTALVYGGSSLHSASAQGKMWQRVRKVSGEGEEWQRSGGNDSSTGEVSGLGATEAAVEYFIAVSDEMEVFVWQNPDLSKNVIVGPDGKISYPLVGRLQAAGLTIGQLEQKIREGLAQYVKYPQVSVMMTKFAGHKIVMLGEVNFPGIYTYQGDMNLIEALAEAGDFTDDAREDSVMIVRGNLTEHPEVMRINMSRVIRRGVRESASRRGLRLMPNDVVFVPKSFIGNFNKFLDNINPTIGTAMDALGLREEIRLLQEHDR